MARRRRGRKGQRIGGGNDGVVGIDVETRMQGGVVVVRGHYGDRWRIYAEIEAEKNIESREFRRRRKRTSRPDDVGIRQPCAVNKTKKKRCATKLRVRFNWFSETRFETLATRLCFGPERQDGGWHHASPEIFIFAFCHFFFFFPNPKRQLWNSSRLEETDSKTKPHHFAIPSLQSLSLFHFHGPYNTRNAEMASFKRKDQGEGHAAQKRTKVNDSGKPKSADRQSKRSGDNKSDSKARSKPDPSEDTRSAPAPVFASVLRDEEPAFARGGGSVLTPLEQKQIQAQANQDVLFEEGTGRAAAESDEEEEEGTEGGAKKPTKKSRKANVKDKSSKEASVSQGVKIEGLSFKVRPIQFLAYLYDFFLAKAYMLYYPAYR